MCSLDQTARFRNMAGPQRRGLIGHVTVCVSNSNVIVFVPGHQGQGHVPFQISEQRIFRGK